MKFMHLFCYGTLVFPEIMRRVSGARTTGSPATLAHFACYAVRGAVYPGIIFEQGARIHGIVYDGITAAQLQRIDRYEGDDYVRQRVLVSETDGRLCRAWAYVIRPGAVDRLTDECWDSALFARHYLASYLREFA